MQNDELNINVPTKDDLPREADFKATVNLEDYVNQKPSNKGFGYEQHVQLIQPWSVPVFKTTLPPDVLSTMLEISDQVIADKNTEHFGKHLAGSIETELLIKHEILKQAGVMEFFLEATRQFVVTCLSQANPFTIDKILEEEWYTQMLNMWIVSQQPGEYNPVHMHTNCQISSVMYLKIPKKLPGRKDHRPEDDGAILFTSNAGTDLDLCVAAVSISPQVGDLFIFGARQLHAVYPYRCAEGETETERRSISFNAVFQSKTESDRITEERKAKFKRGG